MIDDTNYKVTMKELLMGRVEFEDLEKDLQDNALELREKINKVRKALNKPMKVTSGYRSMEDHLRIYRELAVKRKQKYDESKVPKQSKHLYCQAVDISDPDGSLFEWTKNNESLLEEIGLWMEEKDDQKRVHFQTVSPKSGKRWFMP